MKVFRPNNKLTGFTLVEIMIVVLIIGILLAIAIPNFVAARESGRAKACVGNLKQIDSAKQQCAIDNKIAGNDTTSKFYVDGTTAAATGVYQLVDTTGASGYLRSIPNCPSGGTYTTGNVIATPSCSTTGASGSGYEKGAKWYHGLN